MKQKTFWLMLFIVVLGTILRLIFIDKPDGLWNDEYVSWIISSIPFGKSFWKAVFAQCHMPFYYFYLKFFMHFFSDSDLLLRLTSIPAGVLSIIAMYFVGKEFKDEKLGILCASVVSLSSFLIYFSQEVRFYGLLFLFSSLVLLFTLKLLKRQNFSNAIFFVFFNLLVIFTHTLGFIFVGLNLLFFTVYLRKAQLVSVSYQSVDMDRSLNKYRMTTIVLWASLVLFSLIGAPLLFKIFTSHPLAQWWGSFSLSDLAFLVTDYFSPVLTNIVSAPDNFFYNFGFGFFFFELIPSAIAIVGIAKSLMRKSDSETLIIARSLFAVSASYVLILVLASITGKLVFITKYSIEIYPILILLFGYGLLEFNKNWRRILIFVFCFLNLFYVLTNPNSAPKLRRSEGHKIVAELLNNAKLNAGDIILLNYYGKDRFEKYFDFSKYRIISINKVTFQQYLGSDTKDDFKALDEGVFVNKFKSEIEDKLNSGQKVAIVVLNTVANISPVQMQLLKNDDKEFSKTPFLFLVFSQLKNKEFELGLKNLRIVRIEQKGSWSVVTFSKK